MRKIFSTKVKTMETKDLKFQAFDKKFQKETNFIIFDNQFRFYDKETKKWKIDDTGERFVMRIKKGLDFDS